jgi:hypothetical protein
MKQFDFFDFDYKQLDTEINLPSIVIENIEGINVVREDLLPGGTKRRAAYNYVLRFPEIENWVYASPRQGYAQLALAYVCKDLGKKAIIYVPDSDEKTELTKQSEALGAEINQVPMGMLTVINKRARDRQGLGWDKTMCIPFGLDHPIIIQTIANFAKGLSIQPKEVWSVMSSGVLSRGLQMAWPEAKVYGVQIGHGTTTEEMGRAITIPKRMPFHKDCPIEERPPFPSSLTYDSKAWKHIKEMASPDSLFWNVGA